MPQVHKYAEALRADRVRHRRADAKRREHHDVVGEFEHDLREALHRANDWLSFFADRRDRHGEKHGERHNLKNVAVHHRFDDAGREYMHDCFNERLRMTLADRFDYVGTRWRESHAYTGLCEIDDRQPDEERRSRYNLEINQRFDAHASDLSQCACAGDSHDDGREDKWGDDRFNEVDEDVAQKINLVSPFGAQPAEYPAHDEPDHDLRRERWPIPWPAH